MLVTLLLARLARISWRNIFRHNRSFDGRRLGVYLAVAVVVVALGLVASAVVAPEKVGWTGWDGITIGATTIVIILVTLVAIPLQSAGEEILFRGAVAPAAGSWFRGVRPAVVVAILVSAASFALVHVSIDPWFVTYLFVFSASVIVMGLISGGLEAAISFHVSNNVIAGIFNAVLAGNVATTADRGAGSGFTTLYIILMVMDVVMLGAVWLMERRTRTVKHA